MTQGSAAVPGRPRIEGLEGKHFAHPLDISARRRMDRLIAGAGGTVHNGRTTRNHRILAESFST